MFTLIHGFCIQYFLQSRQLSIIFAGKDSPPALSLHGRPKDPKLENFPAPGDYDPDKAEKVIHDNAPKYTFGLKTNVDKPVDTPGKSEF